MLSVAVSQKLSLRRQVGICGQVLEELACLGRRKPPAPGGLGRQARRQVKPFAETWATGRAVAWRSGA